jgi:hypothetical protein
VALATEPHKTICSGCGALLAETEPAPQAQPHERAIYEHPMFKNTEPDHEARTLRTRR